MDEKLKAEIARPLGQIPSGCFVLTARHDGRSTGILTSWVQQAAFEPPMVTVAIKRGRAIVDLVRASGHFVLNHVPENPLPMFKRFGRGVEIDTPVFDGLAIDEDPAGIVVHECAAHLSCKLVSQMEAGDHCVYLAEVIGGGTRLDIRPYVHLRTNGLSY